jgi:hypothetical protein
MRITYYEEKMRYMYATDDKDHPVKKNIELRVKCSFSSKECFLYVYAVSLKSMVTTAKKQT